MKTKTFFLVSFILLFKLDLCSQNNDGNCGCKAFILCDDKSKLTFKKEENKYVNLEIHNQGNDTIFIPNWLVLGKKGDSDAEVLVIVEKWDVSSNKFKPIISDIVFDYDYETHQRDSIALPPNARKIYREDVGFSSSIDKQGKYRFKLIIRNICKMPETELDWIEFEVI